MSLREAAKSARQLLSLYAATRTNPNQFRYVDSAIEVNPDLVDVQGWDDYWKAKQRTSTFLYEVTAAAYRRVTLRGRLNHFVRKHFPPGARLLHAGCGSGQLDLDLQADMDI